MANTITYDPSDDPQALAEREATDTDNIKVAEDMIREEQDLLAGKYKNAEELEKAYIELQRQMGKGNEATPQETQEAADTDYGRPYLEDGTVDYDTVEDIYGEQIATVMETGNVDPFKMAQHFNENNGTLTPEMEQELVNAGFPAETVQAYLKGARADAGFNPTVENLSSAEITEIQGIAGGKAAYDNLTSWAEQNLPAEDVSAFDEVVNTGNKAAVKFAVKALNAQYEDAVGRQPDLVTGKTSTRGDKYRSMAEVVRDMGDPRYEQDEAYRYDIMQKIERSNLKV